MQNIRAKDAIAYVTMPRIIPRFKSFFSSGFAYFAFLMAHVYGMVKLLPQGHPYTLTKNIGRFGVLHVISEASRGLNFSIKHIDQVIVFFALLGAIVMLIAQFLLLVYALLVSPAMAFSWFDTPLATNDIAFNLLDRVFGVPNIFCSNAGTCTAYALNTTTPILGGPPIPLPFHVALHGLFRYYSIGLLLIAMLIFMYFIVVIVVETAVTGSPFGQRFQNVWVPVRLVVALGLLVPLNFGLNSGQLIVLYVAKYGSSMATNGWQQFNDGIVSHPLFSGLSGHRPTGEPYTMVAIPEAPDITPLLKSMAIIHACAYAYHRVNGGATGAGSRAFPGGGNYEPYTGDYTDPAGNYQIKAYLVKSRPGGSGVGTLAGMTLDPSIRRGPLTLGDFSGATTNFVRFYYGGDIIIRFGEYRTDDSYQSDVGNVKPLCGDLRVPVYDIIRAGSGAVNGGADQMLQYYLRTIGHLWFQQVRMQQQARVLVEFHGQNSETTLANICNNPTWSGTGTAMTGFAATTADCISRPLPLDVKRELIRLYTEDATLGVRAAVLDAWGNYVVNGFDDGNIDPDILERGWGGAGIWYNKIAEVNSLWIDSVINPPYLGENPLVVEEMMEKVVQTNETTNGECEFGFATPSSEEAPDTAEVGGSSGDVDVIGKPLCHVYDYWSTYNLNPENLDRTEEGNPITSAMNMLLGTSGLLNLRSGNVNLHPMAQLVAVGKSLVNSAIMGMAASTGSAFLGGAILAMDSKNMFGRMAKAASSMFFAVAFLGLTVGFILFYVLPFLPFIYFYFAVASWIKAIFEAMVGVPLWALAHLRIDGEGLPGDAAQNGYFLILEIFIRPILTVAGLLAAVSIFAAQVRILHIIWDLVTANAAGFTNRSDILGQAHADDLLIKRPVVDQFFFTIVYAMVCYMLALASFKLIDKIPDNILRWAGAGVSSFGDIDQDQVESVNRYAAMGGMTLGNQAAGAIRGAAEGAGNLFGDQIRKLNEPAAGSGSGTNQPQP